MREQALLVPAGTSQFVIEKVGRWDRHLVDVHGPGSEVVDEIFFPKHRKKTVYVVPDDKELLGLINPDVLGVVRRERVRPRPEAVPRTRHSRGDRVHQLHVRRDSVATTIVPLYCQICKMDWSVSFESSEPKAKEAVLDGTRRALPGLPEWKHISIETGYHPSCLDRERKRSNSEGGNVR